MTDILHWVAANWLMAFATFIYVVANVVPRPDPATLSPGWATLWRVVDRLCFLTRDKLPGGLKAIGVLSPVYTATATPQVVASAAASAQSGSEEKKP